MAKKILPMSAVNKKSRPIMSTESFIDSIESLHPGKYTILGEYKGWDFPIDVIYNECGHNASPKAKYLHYGKGCGKCHGPQNKTHEQFVERIEELYPGKYTILGKYTKSNERIKVMYNECGHVADPKSSYIRQGSGCPVCNNGVALTQEEFLGKFNNIVGDEYVPLEQYVSRKYNMNIKHKVCGTIFKRNVGALLQNGCKCPKCFPESATYLIVGINDIHTIDPEMESLLKFPEDAYKHTRFSKDKVWFICPQCGNEIYVSCNNVASQGLKCCRCNVNYSYGERFIYNWFLEMGIDFEYQFNPDWIKPYLFDFMFEFGNKHYIVEVDGAQHFEDVSRSVLTLQELQNRDAFKQSMAEKYGYTVIRLDYNYKANESKSLHLINSIENSDLFNVLGISDYDFTNVIDVSSKSIIRVVADIWNSYDKKSISRIQQDLNIKNDNRVRSMLYLASELNMINESKDEIKKLNRAYAINSYGHSRSKKVKCVETGEIFSSMKEANKKYSANISNYFRESNRKYTGALPDGTRLTWEKVGW